jgi:hypothetical protein
MVGSNRLCSMTGLGVGSFTIVLLLSPGLAPAAAADAAARVTSSRATSCIRAAAAAARGISPGLREWRGSLLLLLLSAHFAHLPDVHISTRNIVCFEKNVVCGVSVGEE